MRAHAIALLLLLSVTSTACSSACSTCDTVAVEFDREAETKAVYVAILSELYARDWQSRAVEQWVIDPEIPASVGGRDELVRQRVWESRPGTIADYERARPAGRVPADLAPGLPVRWFTKADFAALPKSGGAVDLGWTAFHEKFPRSPGHITLSHVGFSADGTEALAHVGCWFDSLGGARRIVRVRKMMGAWQVEQDEQTAVS